MQVILLQFKIVNGHYITENPKKFKQRKTIRIDTNNVDSN